MSLLGALNFVLLQWFCIRLQVSFSRVVESGQRSKWWDREIPVEDVVTWKLLRWVVPLTGWWSNYRYLKRVP